MDVVFLAGSRHRHDPGDEGQGRRQGAEASSAGAGESGGLTRAGTNGPGRQRKRRAIQLHTGTGLNDDYSDDFDDEFDSDSEDNSDEQHTRRRAGEGGKGGREGGGEDYKVIRVPPSVAQQWLNSFQEGDVIGVVQDEAVRKIGRAPASVAIRASGLAAGSGGGAASAVDAIESVIHLDPEHFLIPLIKGEVEDRAHPQAGQESTGLPTLWHSATSARISQPVWQAHCRSETTYVPCLKTLPTLFAAQGSSAHTLLPKVEEEGEGKRTGTKPVEFTDTKRMRDRSYLFQYLEESQTQPNTPEALGGVGSSARPSTARHGATRETMHGFGRAAGRRS